MDAAERVQKMLNVTRGMVITPLKQSMYPSQRHDTMDTEIKSSRRSLFRSAAMIAFIALLPVPAFAQRSASPAADNASKMDAEKRAVAHPPVDVASGAGVATSLPISAPPLSDPAKGGQKPQSPTPDAPLAKPY
jgi:hypothetical protein